MAQGSTAGKWLAALGDGPQVRDEAQVCDGPRALDGGARGLGRGVVIGVRVSGDWFKVACVRARADVHVHPARARIPYSRTDRERRRQMDRH